MSKALVRARGIATPEQFKTDWSQFMKQNIAMNLMVYPNDMTMNKSDAKVSVKFAIPKVMVEKGETSDKCYVGIFFKDDTNAWQFTSFDLTLHDFNVPLDLGGNDYLEIADAQDFPITAANVTALSKYDMHIIYSDQPITAEVAEGVNDLPFTLWGPASEYITEVTCAA